MKQNIYDDPDFFEKYADLPRSKNGLMAAGEWKAFAELIPTLSGKKVLDLGCGYGWHCRYLKESGAAEVVGLDLSEKMLEKAREKNKLPGITYYRSAIEDLNFSSNEFDIVISSLALHYIQDIETVFKNVFKLLKPGGSFVFSTEHPIFTSRESQDWIRDASGKPLHWAVDKYQEEGERKTNWLTDNVIKYHRTFSTLINALLKAGFQLQQIVEPAVSAEMIQQNPSFADENRRPMFIVISAVKNGNA